MINEMSDSACDLSASTFSEMSPLTQYDRFSSTRAMALGGALLVPLRDVGTCHATFPFPPFGRRDFDVYATFSEGRTP